MRNRFRSSAAALAVMSSLSLLASACTDAQKASDSDADWSGPVGSLGLALELAPGVVVNAVDYQITGQGFTLEGTLNVPGGVGSTFNAIINEVPAGSGHVIKLRAVAAGDAGLACAGQATFSVSAGTTTQVDVVLSCDGIDLGGSASINGSFNICPSITASTLSPTVQLIGSSISVMVSARDVDMGPTPLTYAWTTTSGMLSNANTSAPTLLCTEAGPVALTYTVRDGACTKTGTFTATCRSSSLDGGAGVDAGVDASSDAGSDAGSPGNPANIVINEVESSGGVPGDWIELYNKGGQAVDVSGWVVRDNDDTHNYAIPSNTLIQPGAYLLLEEAQFGFGLGGADAARIYTPSAATLVDSFSWSAHATGTYGRCPNGLGAFVDAPSTKGSTNACASAPSDAGADAGNDAGSDGGVATIAWPGSNTVSDVDAPNTWTSNLSGLAYQAGTPNILWGVQNDPSKIFRLEFDGTIWKNSTATDWGAGKTIQYSNAAGRPDSEGITRGAGNTLYVSSERDNANNSISKLVVLQFDSTAAGTTLPALRQWDLTADLPAVGANLGLEGVAFIADSELLAQSFKEDSGAAYNQARYAQNGGGVFAVGVEGTGMIHLYALDHGAGGAFTRIASFASGFPGVMDVSYDPDTHYLWAWADNSVGNKAALFEIEQSMVSLSYGKFVLRKVIDRPSGLPNSNNEGIAFVPDAQCAGGFRAFFWADDDNSMSHSLRQGALTCGKSY